jgi:hypothetical protein
LAQQMRQQERETVAALQSLCCFAVHVNVLIDLMQLSVSALGHPGCSIGSSARGRLPHHTRCILVKEWSSTTGRAEGFIGPVMEEEEEEEDAAAAAAATHGGAKLGGGEQKLEKGWKIGKWTKCY